MGAIRSRAVALAVACWGQAATSVRHALPEDGYDLDGPGVARAQRRDDDGLHARAESGRERSAEPMEGLPAKAG